MDRREMREGADRPRRDEGLDLSRQITLPV